MITEANLETRPKLEGGKRFVLDTEFHPAGDQPTAILELTKGISDGEKNQVLLGATGTGKTFTMAKIIYTTGAVEVGGEGLLSVSMDFVAVTNGTASTLVIDTDLS